MSEEQKTRTVAEMKELSGKFKASAEQILEYARALDAEIKAVEKAERLAARDKTLADVSPRAKEVLGSSEVTFFINLASSPEYVGFADAAFSSAHKLYWAAQNTEGAKISAFHWGRDRVQQLDVSGHNSLNAARASEDSVSKNEEREDKTVKDRRMLPLAKKLLEWNTPDRQGDKARNYIVVTAGTALDDNAGHVSSLIETVLKLNPKATVDLVVCGPSGDNSVLVNGARRMDVATVDAMEAALTGILRDRVNAAPPAVHKAVPAAPAAP